MVREESNAHLRRFEASKLQQWNGSEAALQILILPHVSGEPLPRYADRAEYLHPDHCALCLQPYDDLEEHLKEARHAGAATPQEYRQTVLQMAAGEGPHSISPQVTRCRNAAYKGKMTDWNFRMFPCACCAREKRRCKLQQVQFPPADQDECPAWLPWSDEEWEVHRQAWWEKVDGILNIESYMLKFFKAEDRFKEAQKKVALFEDGSKGNGTFATQEAAEFWLRLVQEWSENLRRDLRSDAVPAPGDAGKMWLLLKSDTLTVNESTGAISCFLCKHCLRDLSKVSSDQKKGKQSEAKMPFYARGNGLWHGPDPKELKDLSYAEAKVINLARIYVSLKRVWLDRGGYARTSASEAPLYHQKNVVAYPSKLDAALRVVGKHRLGLCPAELAKTMVVQFVGGDRQALRFQKDLQVSVRKLRAAFAWLSANSWPFLEAIREGGFLNDDALHGALETLLQDRRPTTVRCLCRFGRVAELKRGVNSTWSWPRPSAGSRRRPWPTADGVHSAPEFCTPRFTARVPGEIAARASSCASLNSGAEGTRSALGPDPPRNVAPRHLLR